MLDIQKCINFLKSKFPNICNYKVEEYNYEELKLFILVSKTCLISATSKKPPIEGDIKFFILWPVNKNIKLENFKKFFDFYEQFVFNKCKGLYRKTQIIICTKGEQINQALEAGIDLYNRSFKDTRTPILIYGT